jgi:hypothetical protein
MGRGDYWTKTVLETYLGPLAEYISPDVARRIVDFRHDSQTEELHYLRQKANDGAPTETERTEYQEFVDALEFMGLLKARARSVLNSRYKPV